MKFNDIHAQQAQNDVSRTLSRGMLFTVVYSAIAAVPQIAYAGTPMGEVLCYVLNLLIGQAGQGIASIGVSAVAISAIMGKASWGFAMTVVVGIGVLFGCINLAAALGLGHAAC